MVTRWAVAAEEDAKSVGRGATRRSRTAEVELRFALVTLRPTSNYHGRSYRQGLPVGAVSGPADLAHRLHDKPAVFHMTEISLAHGTPHLLRPLRERAG